MANEKSVFKIWSCKCGYKKHDCNPGKVATLCTKDQRPMALSTMWYARTTRDGVTSVKAISTRKQEAMEYVNDCKKAARLGTLQPGKEKDITWEKAVEYCREWWADAVIREEIREKTREFYIYRLPALNSFFKGKTLLTITKTDIEKFQTFRRKANASPTTVSHEQGTLRMIYTLHIKNTTEEESPKLCAKARDLHMVKRLKKAGNKLRFLDEDEIRRLLATASTPELLIMIEVAISTGLRLGNVLGLTWKSISLSRGIIEIHAENMKGKKDHTIELPANTVNMLKEQRKKSLLSAWVFLNKDATGPIAISEFKGQWRKTMDDCGFNLINGVPVDRRDAVTFHTLRHTFASQFLMAGGDLVTLSELLGHASIATTKNNYGHFSRDHKRKAVDEFAKAFLNQFF